MTTTPTGTDPGHGTDAGRPSSPGMGATADPVDSDCSVAARVAGPEVADPGLPGQGDGAERSGQSRADTVVRRRRVEGRQRRLTITQVILSLVLGAAFVALAFVGYRTSLRIGGGSADRITDPATAGYLAEPRPTPVDLFVVNAPDGSFASALLVVPDSSGAGGTIVPLPPSMVLPEVQGAPPAFVGELVKQSGLEGLRERLGVALGFRIASAEVVSPEALARLAGGSPVVIENVDNLIQRNPDGTETLRYPAGTVTLQPSELADFLAFQGADDPAPNQALRAQLVWEQLLAAATGADLSGLPEGERSEGTEAPGFGASLESLVAGEQHFDLLPMDKIPVPDSYFVAWMPDPEALGAFVADVVPLPQSPLPGARVSVALLNGTSDPEAISAAIPAIVRSGGEVTLVGNAESLELPTSRVVFSSPQAAETAQKIAVELGIPATEGKTVEGAVIDVVLGADKAG